MLEKLVKNKDIGTVIMEVSRNYMPRNNFLNKVREITKKNKITLILMSVALVLEKRMEDFI